VHAKVNVVAVEVGTTTTTTTSSQGAGQASMPLRRKNLTKNYTKN